MTLALVTLATAASAAPLFVDFEDLDEDFQGVPFTHQGLVWHDLNNVSGVFPDGETFGPQVYDQVIVENAALLYPSHPDFGSPIHTLTFGASYITGDNVSLGRLSNVTVDLPQWATSIGLDICYYENGPWGGIEIHMDVLRNGEVVGSDSFVIADGGGRDNTADTRLVVQGVVFDQVKLYATYGAEYSLPRVLIDDIQIRWGRSPRFFDLRP